MEDAPLNLSEVNEKDEKENRIEKLVNKNAGDNRLKNLYENVGTRVSKLREINDNYEMKINKKENRKLLNRYEDSLDENNELKKKMILIEEIVINKQNELYNNLKKGFKDLLIFLNINNKSRGKIIYFLNLIQFSEQEIKMIIGKKK
jgi:CRISPR/Cas system-associated endonuclease Cas3-HD